MARRYSIAEARGSLPGLVREAEEGHAVEITRRGKPVAVVLSVGEYERLVRRRVRFSSVYRQLRESLDLERLDIDPNEVFGDLRDRTPGRDVEL
jgi:prevent-host-death family protein